MKDDFDEFKVKAQEKFKNHVATMKDLGEVKILNWRNPECGFYAMQFMIQGGHLFVTGDFYNATYSWSCPVDFEALRTYNLDYFYSKINFLNHSCLCEWDDKKAIDALERSLDDLDFSEEFKKEILSDASDRANSEYEWVSFLHNHQHLVDDECSLYSAGNTMPQLVKYHFLGLQMSIEQWQNKQVKAEQEAEASK